MNEILKKIALSQLQFDEAIPIDGGDINDAFRLERDHRPYFLKLNVADSFPELFRKEAFSLQKLAQVENILVPKVIETGESEDNFQYLILDWIERENPTNTSWQNLGFDLARIHQTTNATFGWSENNYLAIILQDNSAKNSWADFYAENRLIPLSKILRDQEIFSVKEVNLIEKLSQKLNDIFPNEAPALLHGDFWNGNILPTQNNKIAFIDPASYFGHREMDLAMSKLFEGFDDQFYESYQEVYPLEKNWAKRLTFAQLYPLMIHALLFKGYYINEVQNILKKL